MPVTRAEFAKQYRALVEGREFVEHQDYYARSIDRFWKAFDKIQRLDLPPGATVIDIGGGIMAVLISKILGIKCYVGDVNEGAAADVRELGIDFLHVDLMSEESALEAMFDLVVLQEVIEHLPQPPYVVFRRIMRFLKPGGLLFVTTPNGSRMRNILYMLAGRPVLDNFRYPGSGESLGHQQEYILPQLVWQLEKAGMAPVYAGQYDDGWKGANRIAHLTHLLLKPANLFPHLRNGLMVAARKTADA